MLDFIINIAGIGAGLIMFIWVVTIIYFIWLLIKKIFGWY